MFRERLIHWLDLFLAEDISLTSHTQCGRGLAPRTFSSFTEIAAEAAMTRTYGGIHFRKAIEERLDVGSVYWRTGEYPTQAAITKF